MFTDCSCMGIKMIDTLFVDWYIETLFHVLFNDFFFTYIKSSLLPTWKIYVSKLSFLSMIPSYVVWNISFTNILTLLNNVAKTNSKCNHVFYQADIKQFTSHTTGCYTGEKIDKLFIWIKHFRDNQLLSESFPGENHFLVSCVQRIILLSLVIFVDHDWIDFCVLL